MENLNNYTETHPYPQSFFYHYTVSCYNEKNELSFYYATTETEQILLAELIVLLKYVNGDFKI